MTWLLPGRDAAVAECVTTLKAGAEGAAHPTLGEGTQWLFCADVDAHIRGYTCGLWTLFHTLTVRAGMEAGSGGGAERVGPAQTALAIHGFISHFFACESCREHFLAAHPVRHTLVLSSLLFSSSRDDAKLLLRLVAVDC